MDDLRKFISGIFKLVLNLCIFSLLMVFTFGGMLQDGISSFIVNNKVVDEMFAEMGVESSDVYELVKSDEVKEFVSGYINPILGESVDIENVNIGSDLVKFVTENKSMIEAKLGKEIPMDKVVEFANSEDVNRVNDTYRDIITQTSSDIEGEANVAVLEVPKVFGMIKFLSSKEFKNMLIFGCLISVIFVMLIEKSFYSWMKSTGKTLAGCGFIIGIMSFLGSILVSKVFNVLGLGSVTVDSKNTLIIGIITFVIGIILLIVHSKVNRHVEERRALNEVSNLLRS